MIGPKNPGETSASGHIQTATRHGALKLFEKSKARLMDVNNWDSVCGAGSAIFRLTNAKGVLLDNIAPQIGNFVRIDLPGSHEELPRYNWLKVEEFESSRNLMKDEDFFEFKLTQVSDPLGNKNSLFDKKIIFQLRRVASKVNLIEVGGSGMFNPDAENFKWKNLVSVFSSLFGFSDPQWKKLVKGVLQKDPIEEQEALFN